MCIHQDCCADASPPASGLCRPQLKVKASKHKTTMMTNIAYQLVLVATFGGSSGKMQDHQVTSSIVDLPDEVLTTVVTALTSFAHGNPGDVCRLMLVCNAAKPHFSCIVSTKEPCHSELQKVESVNARYGALLATALHKAGLGSATSNPNQRTNRGTIHNII